MFAVAALDALTANIAILNASGRIVAVNGAWERFAQLNSVHRNVETPGGAGHGSGLGADYLAICEATQGEDRPYALKIAAHIQAVLEGQPEGETEYPCMLPDGLHYFLARVSGFSQTAGSETAERYAVVAHEDITRRKRAELEVLALNRRLEQRVLQRNQELEERNAELQRVGDILTQRNEALIESNLQLARFAHVASHDLQEPLRIVGAYADMLRHRYHQELGSRGQGYLNHITDQVMRARQMVRDVLAFSGVSQPLHTEPLLLGELWQEAVRFLDWPPDTKLACGELPAVLVNPAQMRQLLGNLLGNSLKFRSREPLEVSLSLAGQSEGFAEFALRDNGIGIEPEYRQQVFGMFQRLHSRSAYGAQGSGGNGIGLAICKKIVEQHGGSIWIGDGDGGAQQGTAIHFTLPLA